MAEYDEEVQCWLSNHSFFFTFWWGLSVAVISFCCIPYEIYWWIKPKLRRR